MSWPFPLWCDVSLALSPCAWSFLAADVYTLGYTNIMTRICLVFVSTWTCVYILHLSHDLSYLGLVLSWTCLGSSWNACIAAFSWAYLLSDSSCLGLVFSLTCLLYKGLGFCTLPLQVQGHFVLSCHLCCVVLSCLVLCCGVSCLLWACLVVPCRVVSLSRRAVSCRVVSCLVFSCFIILLSRFALKEFALLVLQGYTMSHAIK